MDSNILDDKKFNTTATGSNFTDDNVGVNHDKTIA